MMEKFKLKLGQNIEADNEEQTSENVKLLEDLLNEEDPDFMKSVSEMNIENAAVDVAVFKPFKIHKYPKQAISFWLLLGGVGYGGFAFYKAHFWTAPSKLFVTSYADLGLMVYDYDMLEGVEPFYDNVRFSKNVMSLVKMTANLRPSQNSSNNPMIAFEIVIHGVSNEAIVEIKDREAEFRDLILRVTEEFTYDDLDTREGKQALSESILAKVNANLTDGQVRKVYYKNIVIKP